MTAGTGHGEVASLAAHRMVKHDQVETEYLLQRQTAVLELIAGTAPLQVVLTEILSSLEQLMPQARCSVLLLDRERGTLHHGAAPRLPADYVAAIDGLRIRDGAGACGTAAALNRVVVVSDVREDPRWADFRDAAEAAGLRACWSTPIEGPDGLPVGTFAVYHPHPYTPTLRDQRLTERFTHLAAVAIGHAGLVGALRASEERFRRSFDDNSLGMAVLAPDRTLATANAALVALSGDDAEALVGVPISRWITPVGAPWDDLLDALLDAPHDGPLVVEADLHRPSDEPRVAVEVTVSLLDGVGRGEAAQYLVNVLDLTERRAAERDRRARLEAETARRTAEELSHAKSELLAAIGHEARTPIQAIVGFAELLGTIDLDEGRRRQALDHIGAAATHVMDLLTDVLDLSRLEAGALRLALEPVPVGEVVAEALDLLSAEAERRAVTLVTDVSGCRARVLADRRRLRQVLLNLAGNAIRHGRAGGTVRITGERISGTTDDEADGVVLTVADDGPGIPPDLLPRLFTPFAHGAPDGVGLGLGLAHGLTSAMGGDLTLAATGPDGTTLQLRLPTA